MCCRCRTSAGCGCCASICPRRRRPASTGTAWPAVTCATLWSERLRASPCAGWSLPAHPSPALWQTASCAAPSASSQSCITHLRGSRATFNTMSVNPQVRELGILSERLCIVVLLIFKNVPLFSRLTICGFTMREALCQCVCMASNGHPEESVRRVESNHSWGGWELKSSHGCNRDVFLMSRTKAHWRRLSVWVEGGKRAGEGWAYLQTWDNPPATLGTMVAMTALCCYPHIIVSLAATALVLYMVRNLIFPSRSVAESAECVLVASFARQRPTGRPCLEARYGLGRDLGKDCAMTN